MHGLYAWAVCLGRMLGLYAWTVHWCCMIDACQAYVWVLDQSPALTTQLAAHTPRSKTFPIFPILPSWMPLFLLQYVCFMNGVCLGNTIIVNHSAQQTLP